MERMKRALCLLLCLVMVVGLVPLTAFAAEASNTEWVELPSGYQYELYTGSVNDIDPDDWFLIVSTYTDGSGGDGNAFRGAGRYALDTEAVATNSTAGTSPVYGTIANIDGNYATLADEDKLSTALWQIDAQNGIKNAAGEYVDVSNTAYSSAGSYYNMAFSNSNNRTWTIGKSGNNFTFTTRYNNNDFKLQYNSWRHSYMYTRSETGNLTFNLYKQTPVGQGGYARLTGDLEQSYIINNATEQTVLDLVKIQTSTDASAVADEVKLTDSDVTIAWDKNFDASSEGTYTATVSYQGVELGEIKVSFAAKSMDESFEPVLTGNTPVTTKLNVEPDFSNIKLEVKFEGEDDTTFIDINSGLVIEGYDITTIGYSYATISYAGKEYGTVRVTVEGDPYAGLDDAQEPYPEYPADGAVRIDKTATQNAQVFKNTGVTHVELDVAGISVKTAVDVILVTDLSNSMAWTAGGRTDATSHAATKIYDLQQSVASFAGIFLAADENGVATKNTISLVTFGGYDADYTDTDYTDYADPTQTLLLGSTDASAVKSTINNIRVLADDALNLGASNTGYYLSFDGGKTYGENYGNTNYDYAFMQTADAIADLKAAYKEANGTEYDASGRQIYILFMTDGAPSNYNGVYYRNVSGNRADVDATWVNSKGEEVNYTMGENGKDTYSNNNWEDYIVKTDLYWAEKVYNTENVANIYSIGFDLDQGGFKYDNVLWTFDRLSSVLAGMVPGQTLEVYSSDNKDGLNDIYKELATKIRFAGTSANVTDVVDSDFTLQMAGISGSGEKHANLSEHGITPKITITSYELVTDVDLGTVVKLDGIDVVITEDMVGSTVTADDASVVLTAEHVGTTMTLDNYAVTITEAHLGARKDTDTYPPVVLETVTFNEAGTEAYSDKVEGNILSTASDGTVTIEGHYFTYTKTPEGVETFKWAIGNITEREVVLAYDVYLKESLEGGCPEGDYNTNEEAILEYIDINGDHATQTFPVPAVIWGGASTTIRFYLVNEYGQPVNRDGTVIPPENRIFVGEPVTVVLNLNEDATIDAQKIEAAAYVPSEYFLYDINAYYTVQTASGDDNSIVSGITASVPSEDAYKTTYDDYGNSTKQNGAQTTVVIDAERTYYTWSYVGFGVRYDLTSEEVASLTEDKVVIDYGKAIHIDVLDNDPDMTAAGFECSISGFMVYNANTKLDQSMLNPGSETMTTDYGVFSIVDGKVQFQPTAIVNDVIDVFYVVERSKTDNAQDTYYVPGKLTVIPATSVYYETDFADGVFTYTQADAVQTTTDYGTDGVVKWITRTDAQIEGVTSPEFASDDVQDDGTIGKNQTYGYDTSYDDDAYYSNGDSMFVEGEGVDYTYVTFSFKGTGLELLSRTGTEQGQIKVEVFSDAAMTTAEKTVTVLNKSESELELYQIPVVSINDLDYGVHYVKVSVMNGYVGTGALAALTRGNEFYFDGIRVFEPVLGNTTAEEAYSADGEHNRVLNEVRGLLITAEDFYALESDADTNGIVFIDRTEDKEGEDLEVDNHNVVSVSTYAAIGPNNETYLAKGQAIAFRVGVNTVPASFDIGAKSITGEAAQLSVTIYSGIDTANAVSCILSAPIKSSTAQNYDLLQNAKDAAAIFANKEAYVVITNEGEGILSITDLKVAYTNGVSTAMALSDIGDMDSGIALASVEAEETEAYDPYAVSYTVSASTFALARTVLTEEAEEEVPEVTEPETTEPEETEPETTVPEETEPETTVPEETEPAEEPDYDIIRASANTKGGLFSRKTYFTVVTSQDVVSLTIKQAYWSVRYSSMTYVDQADGTRVWTIAMPSIAIGTYTITGYGTDGTSGASATVRSWGL